MEKESMENKEEEGCSAGETAGKYRTMTMRKKIYVSDWHFRHIVNSFDNCRREARRTRGKKTMGGRNRGNE